MGTCRPDHSLGDGVYFAPADYIGFGPRLVILAVDLGVLFVMLMLLTAIGAIAFDGGEPMTSRHCVIATLDFASFATRRSRPAAHRFTWRITLRWDTALSSPAAAPAARESQHRQRSPHRIRPSHRSQHD